MFFGIFLRGVGCARSLGQDKLKETYSSIFFAEIFTPVFLQKQLQIDRLCCVSVAARQIQLTMRYI